jgi:hypothetical protein
MAKLNRPCLHTTEPKQDRVYLLDITFASGMKCIKIGKSSGKSSLDRMLQIQRDYYNKYRVTFICNIKRDRPVDDAFKVESELHKFFQDYKYTPKVPFDGSTELFCIPIEAATEVYEYILENGVDSLKEYKYDPEVYREEIDELPF